MSKLEVLLTKSTRRIVLPCLIGILIAFGPWWLLTLQSSPCNFKYVGESICSITGITSAKLSLLLFFIGFLWPIQNLMNVEVFRRIDYGDLDVEGVIILFILHSASFFVGATVTTIMTKGKWILFVVGSLFITIILMLASIVHYTGPGGPAWLYPSPYYLGYFTIWISIIGLLARGVYAGGRRLVGSSKEKVAT